MGDRATVERIYILDGGLAQVEDGSIYSPGLNRENFVHRRVPAFNADPRATVASMDKVDALLRAEGATLWVNHDMAQSEGLPHALE